MEYPDKSGRNLKESILKALAPGGGCIRGEAFPGIERFSPGGLEKHRAIETRWFFDRIPQREGLLLEGRSGYFIPRSDPPTLEAPPFWS